MINIMEILQYNTGTQITKLLTGVGREDLKEFKPYSELPKDKGIDLLQAILPSLTSKKQELAILKLSEFGVETGGVAESEPVSIGKVQKEKASPNTKDVKTKAELESLKKKYDELETKYNEILSEIKAVRLLLEYDKEGAND